MFFEGRCFARELQQTLLKCVTTPDPVTKQPLWDMVSTNIGTALTDDGYVFRSRTGSPMVFGIKSESAQVNNNHWIIGFRTFTAASYTPGPAPGQNGLLPDLIFDATPFLAVAAGYTLDNLPIRYWISVKSDRVILAYKTDLLSYAHSRSNVIYFGKPAVNFGSTDQGFVHATAMSPYVGNSAARVSGVSSSNQGYQSVDLHTDPPQANKVWGKQVFPSTVLVHNRQGGIRGLLDVLVLKQDGRLRQIENIRVDGRDYLGLEVPHRSYFNDFSAYYYNNFTQANIDSVILIPKD